MTIALLVISILVFLISIFFVTKYLSYENNSIENKNYITGRFAIIGMVITNIVSVLTTILSIIFYTPSLVDIGADAGRVTNNYRTANPNDETRSMNVNYSELVDTLANYKKSVPKEAEIDISISNIRFDAAFGEKYLIDLKKNHEDKFKEFIKYYRIAGHTFDENTDLKVIASKVLEGRNSFKITLSNNKDVNVKHYDMGRLCPPNCPK